jgi:DNA gyrase/topoisomerase IV subunit B
VTAKCLRAYGRAAAGRAHFVLPDGRRFAHHQHGAIPGEDDIFTKLMGDVVEPRREFIQDYSLNANVVVLLG